MITCRRETGERFLCGRLSEVEAAQFVEHLDSCDSCRRWLEQDAGDERIWQSARDILGHPTGVLCGSSDRPDACGTASSTETQPLVAVARIVAPLLAPTDDPAMLGRIGAYEAIGVIGRGGMGIVLKAFDRALHRNVAIKVLDPALVGVGAARQRFSREARAMAAISHEHVVRVYAVDQHAGLPYFVMEYVSGGTLDERLRDEGSLDVVSVVRIALQTAQALAAAHAQGLIHRDIKPANVLVDRGTEGVRVADFGLARVAHEVSATRSGLVAGTPQYMSPEQVRAEACDAKSDLFSLGSLMYALATAHAPFRAETVYGVMQRIVHDQPRSIREQNAQIPDWLEDFILRLLAKEKSQRFESAQQVVDILQVELAHLQSPHSAAEPARRWRPQHARLRRWPVQRVRRAAVVVGAAAMLAVATSVWVWTSRRPPSDALQNPYVSPPASASGAADASLVPLWEADGTHEALSFADAVEASWHAPPSAATRDPWTSEVDVLRQRMAEMAVELSDPMK